MKLEPNPHMTKSRLDLHRLAGGAPAELGRCGSRLRFRRSFCHPLNWWYLQRFNILFQDLKVSLSWNTHTIKSLKHIGVLKRQLYQRIVRWLLKQSGNRKHILPPSRIDPALLLQARKGSACFTESAEWAEYGKCGKSPLSDLWSLSFFSFHSLSTNMPLVIRLAQKVRWCNPGAGNQTTIGLPSDRDRNRGVATARDPARFTGSGTQRGIYQTRPNTN